MLQFIKIQEGVGEGNMLFHSFMNNTEEELQAILAAKEEELWLKAQRQDQLAQNVQCEQEWRDAHRKNLVGMIAMLRYVSIKPDNEKLANGTDVLNLLIDTLLMEGFHLVTPRTVSSEEKTECYGFERKKRPEALVLNKSETRVSVMPEQSQKKK
ncbi:potassium channel regulator [Phyllostomus discolor]|uniref:Potassium channel regulator n=1 Tax=Phyllostomus discolor TaxID=89673 RepID=A0A833YZ14_9CHIR|nr:potassium channel regulator [Phyllostomus discolor]